MDQWAQVILCMDSELQLVAVPSVDDRRVASVQYKGLFETATLWPFKYLVGERERKWDPSCGGGHSCLTL